MEQVEDFIDRSQNVARAVRVKERKIIYRCIHMSLDYLMQFLTGQGQGNNLRDILFERHTASTLEVGVTSHIGENENNLPTLQNCRPQKKRRVLENLEKNQAGIPREKKIVQGLQGTELPTVGWMQQCLDKTVRHKFASYTPPVSYQPPLAIPSTNTKMNYSCSPATHTPFSSNPVVFECSSNPPIQSHLSSQSSQGFVGTVHQKAIAPNPHVPSIHSHPPQVGYNPHTERAFYNHRIN